MIHVQLHVNRVQLGHVDQRRTHQSSGKDTTVCEVRQRSAIQTGHLLLLKSPAPSSSLSTVTIAVNAGPANLLIMVDRAVDHDTRDPQNASVRDEDIEMAIKVPNDLILGSLDPFMGFDVAFVNLTCIYLIVGNGLTTFLWKPRSR